MTKPITDEQLAACDNRRTWNVDGPDGLADCFSLGEWDALRERLRLAEEHLELAKNLTVEQLTNFNAHFEIAKTFADQWHALRERLRLAEEHRDQWHEWADAHGSEVERLIARLALADAVVNELELHTSRSSHTTSMGLTIAVLAYRAAKETT